MYWYTSLATLVRFSFFLFKYILCYLFWKKCKHQKTYLKNYYLLLPKWQPSLKPLELHSRNQVYNIYSLVAFSSQETEKMKNITVTLANLRLITLFGRNISCKKCTFAYLWATSCIVSCGLLNPGCNTSAGNLRRSHRVLNRVCRPSTPGITLKNFSFTSNSSTRWKRQISVITKLSIKIKL